MKCDVHLGHFELLRHDVTVVNVIDGRRNQRASVGGWGGGDGKPAEPGLREVHVDLDHGAVDP